MCATGNTPHDWIRTRIFFLSIAVNYLHIIPIMSAVHVSMTRLSRSVWRTYRSYTNGKGS